MNSSSIIQHYVRLEGRARTLTRQKRKGLDEPLADFIQRKGGINKCAARFA